MRMGDQPCAPAAGEQRKWSGTTEFATSGAATHKKTSPRKARAGDSAATKQRLLFNANVEAALVETTVNQHEKLAVGTDRTGVAPVPLLGTGETKIEGEPPLPLKVATATSAVLGA